MKPIRWSAIVLSVCLFCSLLSSVIAEETIVSDEQFCIEGPVVDALQEDESISPDIDTISSENVEPIIAEVDLYLDDNPIMDDVNDFLCDDSETVMQNLSENNADIEDYDTVDEVESETDYKVVDTNKYMSGNIVSSEVIGDYKVSLYDDKTCCLEEYYGSSQNLVIPSSINGYTVDTIAYGYGFYSNQALKSVVFPETIRTIGVTAFSNCRNLETITFKTKDLTLANCAFSDCISLKRVVFPSEMTYFWWYYHVFWNCTSLESITIPKILTRCDRNNCWFEGCTKLTVSFQNGIKTICNNCLDGSYGIRRVNIPSSVTSIGANAFNECWNCAVYIYSDNITYIAKGAFKHCGSVWVVKGSNTYKYCKSQRIKVKTFDPYAPSGITLKASGSTLLTPKKGVQLTATLAPANARSKLTWKSSKKSVATVSKNGFVKAKKKGTTTITVKTANGKKASIKITVKANPKKVTLSAKSLALNVGKTAQLTATLPKNTYATLSYSSSNAAVARVDQSGKVTAVKGGQATITVTTSNGKRASCLVTVLTGPAPTSLTLNAATCTLKPKGKFTIVPKINSGASTAYTFTTSNRKVATVAANGVITAKKKGKAVITVRTHNGLTAKITVTVKK